jgi:lysine 2,3-aminomutase
MMNATQRGTLGRVWKDISDEKWSDWVWQLKNRIHTIPQLAEMLGKSPESLVGHVEVTNRYPVCITPYYFSLMNLEDENDPVRLQCFPDAREIHFSVGGVQDPLEEERNMPVPGLIHRYRDRCVTIMTNVCMTHCRHCNRKRMWGNEEWAGNGQHLRGMIDYIEKTKAIREVIISGGDPLTLHEEILTRFIVSLRFISHVEVLRIGSRVPVVMPMRVTPSLCSMLRGNRPLWFITQFNHPIEITEESAGACEMLLNAGIPVLNQSVLLRGINDNYETMRDLLYGLEKISVKPYYLFQCDAVEGTDHFRADILKGIEIMEKLWENMPGLCIPQYVLDIPGQGGKVPLFPCSHPSAKCGTGFRD